MTRNFNQKYTTRFILAGAIIARIVILAIYGIKGSFSISSITAGENDIYQFVQHNYVGALFVYILIIALFTAIFTPATLVLTLASGYLFGTLAGALATSVGATLGSCLAFFSSRYLLHDLFRSKLKKRLANFDRHLHKQGSNYLLFLRLAPIIPAFIINLVAGLTKIKFRTFVWTTTLGNLPADFIYAYAGSQVHQVHSLGEFFSLEIFLALLLLSLASLFPIWLRKKEHLED